MPFDFTQSLIILLIGLLFFKENILQWLGAKYGFKTKSQERAESVEGTVLDSKIDLKDSLVQSLEDALSPLKRQIGVLGSNHIEHVQQSINEVQKTQTAISQTLFEIKTSLQNIEKYGINCRK